MITNIWLKKQPNKKIPYPDCYPEIRPAHQGNAVINIKDCEGMIVASYATPTISRQEFRP